MTAIVDTELRLVVLEGASLVPRVRELVQRCTTDPDPGQDLARACGQVVSDYLDLRKRLWAMPQNAQIRRVELLLDYQQQILEQAALLAFRPRLGSGGRWAALAARFGHETDVPGEQLIQLAGLGMS
jgi:hypothetical protein